MHRINEDLDIVAGIFLLLVLHIVALTILGFLAFIFGSFSDYIFFQILINSIFGIGLAQLFYVIPVVIWLNRRQEWGRMKGVIIGAVLTALLNGGCFLWIFWMSR